MAWYDMEILESFRGQCAGHLAAGGSGDLAVRLAGMPAGSHLVYGKVSGFKAFREVKWKGQKDSRYDAKMHYPEETWDGWHFYYLIPELALDTLYPYRGFTCHYRPRVNDTCIQHYDFDVFAWKLQDYFNAVLCNSREEYGWKNDMLENTGTAFGATVYCSVRHGCMAVVRDGQVVFDCMVDFGNELEKGVSVVTSEKGGALCINFGCTEFGAAVEMYLDPQTFDVLNKKKPVIWDKINPGIKL